MYIIAPFSLEFDMSLSPQKFRELVIQMLFALELSNDEEGLIQLLMDEVKVTQKIAKLAYDKALQIWASRSEIDEIIRQLSISYEFERIGQVEKGILRQAVSELKVEAKAIVIAEAIRLTCKFSTKEAAQFVNAILDAVPTIHCAPVSSREG